MNVNQLRSYFKKDISDIETQQKPMVEIDECLLDEIGGAARWSKTIWRKTLWRKKL